MRILLIALTPIVTAGSLCFGVFPGLHQVALMVHALRARNQTARFHSRAVLLSALSHLAWFPLYAVAAAALPNTSMGTVGAATGASLIHALILAPFALFVPAHLTLPPPDRGIARVYPMPNLDHALAQWDRLRWRHRVALFALRVVPVIAGFGLFFVCRQWMSWRYSFVLASLAYGLGVFAYAEAAAAAHLKTQSPNEAPASSARYLAFPAIGCAILGASLFVFGVLAATEPAPMDTYSGPLRELSLPVPLHPLLHPDGQPISSGSAILPGSDVHLQPFPGGVTIETADGGGAGRVLAFSPHEDAPDVLSDYTWVDEREDGFDIYQNTGGWRTFSITRTGVRTDDGLARRLRSGLGLSALLLFGAGLLLIALSAWLLGSAARIRRRLHGIRSIEELGSPDCVGAIQGTFHGKAYNVSGVEGRMVIQLKGEGEIRAHLGGGIVRFRLPEAPTQSIGVPKDGETVTLTGVFSNLGAQFRAAAVEWPSDALILAGDKDTVARGLTRRALRPTLFVLVMASAAWVAALFNVVIHRL